MEEVTVKDVLSNIKSGVKFIFSKWLIIVISGSLSFAIGVLYRWYIGPTYQASMSFVSENSGGEKLGGYASLAAQFGIDLGNSGGGAFEGDNLLQVLLSRKLVVETLLSNSVANDKLLIEDFISSEKLLKPKDLYASLFRRDINVPNRLRDSILNLAYKKIKEEHLSATRMDKKLNFMIIDVTSKSETFAKTFIEKLSKNAIKFYSEYKTKKASQNVSLLQYQCDSLKQLLFGSIIDVAQTTDLNINPVKQIVRSASQKKQVDVQANTAMYTEVLKQLALAKITLQKETPLIQVIDAPVYPLKKVNFGRLVTGLIFSFVTLCVVVAALFFLRNK